MAIKFHKIQPGMTLYDCHSYTMGNTTMRCLGLWTVHVKSVDPVAMTAVVSWNSNPVTTWNARRLEKLYASPPKRYINQSGL